MAVTDCLRRVPYKRSDGRQERCQCDLEGAWCAYLETVKDSLDLFEEDRRGYDNTETVSWNAVGFGEGEEVDEVVSPRKCGGGGEEGVGWPC